MKIFTNSNFIWIKVFFLEVQEVGVKKLLNHSCKMSSTSQVVQNSQKVLEPLVNGFGSIIRWFKTTHIGHFKVSSSLTSKIHKSYKIYPKF